MESLYADSNSSHNASSSSDALAQRLREALLDSWDGNNTILLNLLRAIPEGGLEARAMESSPSVYMLAD
jgi:hypothetical protein